MIPYFEAPSWSLGPLTIHLFGILAALGVWIGARGAARGASRYARLDPAPLERAVLMVAAFGAGVALLARASSARRAGGSDLHDAATVRT